MTRNILITGASGFVGKNLLEEMLKNKEDIFYPLVRSQESMDSIIKRQKNGNGRLKFFWGDVEYPLCKVAMPFQTVNNERIKEIDVLIHCAADTDFSEDKTPAEMERMYRRNIGGTKNVIELAKILNPKKILYYSTAYASGKKTGIIPDENVIVTEGFKNYYEETKYLARQLILNSELPFSIINPTIVIGNYSNGDAEGEKRMIYGYLHAMHAATRFRIPKIGGKRPTYNHYFESVKPGEEIDCDIRLVGNKQVMKNVVPVDQLVKASIAVMNSQESIGRIYNVGGTEFTIGFMLDSMQKALKVKGFRFDPEWNGTGKDGIERGLADELAPYRPYVTISDPTWDNSNLKSLGINFPRITPEKFDEMMIHYVENYLLGR